MRNLTIEIDQTTREIGTYQKKAALISGIYLKK